MLLTNGMHLQQSRNKSASKSLNHIQYNLLVLTTGHMLRKKHPGTYREDKQQSAPIIISSYKNFNLITKTGITRHDNAPSGPSSSH